MKTVFVSGCFDILHSGHIQFFKDARALGDRLIVCAASSATVKRLKGRASPMSDENKREVLASLRMVDDVVTGDFAADDPGMDFKGWFLKLRPDILAVTEDDQFGHDKKMLCALTGANYVVLPKAPPASGIISTTQIHENLSRPTEVPLRVDFAGGWLDVARNATPDGYVVNMAIKPTVSLNNWPYEKNAGLGGSAAWAILNGQDPVASDRQYGCGWQDAAIINQRGLCIWESHPDPVSFERHDADWLTGLLAVGFTYPRLQNLNIPALPRDYTSIVLASQIARLAVRERQITRLADAIAMTYVTQLDEEMPTLPYIGQIAAKYCGAGHGGYALYLFRSEDNRAVACKTVDLIPIEPHPYHP